MSLSDCDAADFKTAVDTLTVTNVVFSASGLTQNQSGGYDVTLPALKATWDASTNPYVSGIQFEYVPTSFSGDTKLTAPQTISALSWTTTDGIVPQGVYDCRWRAAGINGDFGDWSSPVSVTMTTDFSGLAGSDGVLDAADLYKFLYKLKLNLWRFDAFSAVNGAAVVDPFATFGEQKIAVTIPGGSAAVFFERTAGGFGLATLDGAAYNISFKASVDSGTATLRLRLRDASNAAITGVSDQSYSLTTTPTTFTWSGISSDDTDMATAKVQFYTANTTDIPSGRVATVTEVMGQTDDYGALHGMVTPWRPNPDEDDLLRYAALLSTLYTAWTAANAGKRVQVNADGSAEEYHDLGPRVVRTIAANYAIVADDRGGYIRSTAGSPIDVTVTADATTGFDGRVCIAVSQRGAGAVTIVPDVGVTVNAKIGGTLVTGGAGDVVQLLRVGADTWDMI